MTICTSMLTMDIDKHVNKITIMVKPGQSDDKVYTVNRPRP